jgi:lycopene cyclase domain-containing protein
MMLYSILLFCSFLVPFVLSFDRKLRFYRQWKYLFPSIAVVAMMYIAVDIGMTRAGIWGFDHRYHSGISLAGLPVEEWMFFLVIPYSSVFLHDVVVLYFPSFKTSALLGRMLQIILIFFFSLVAIRYYPRVYTFYSSALVISALIFSLADKSGMINHYWVTFLIILVPFVIVNGILTGSLIDGEIVWYSDESILGIRFLTIPVEDFGYGFSLVLFVILLRNYFIKWFGAGIYFRRIQSHAGND